MRTATVGKKYTNAEIAYALERYKANGYNAKRTSIEVGISRDSIKRWSVEYGETPPTVERIEEPEIVEVIEAQNVVSEDIMLLDQAITEAIKRTKELIPNCRNAVEASTVAKNLAKVRMDLTVNVTEEKKQKTNNILQATINILNKQE